MSKYYLRDYVIVPNIRIMRNAIPFIDELHTEVWLEWWSFRFRIYRNEKPLKDECN